MKQGRRDVNHCRTRRTITLWLIRKQIDELDGFQIYGRRNVESTV